MGGEVLRDQKPETKLRTKPMPREMTQKPIPRPITGKRAAHAPEEPKIAVIKEPTASTPSAVHYTISIPVDTASLSILFNHLSKIYVNRA